jgi:hypothetical protein
VKGRAGVEKKIKIHSLLFFLADKKIFDKREKRR